MNLTPEDADYEDAIACVSMYWQQAVLLSPQDQQEMIQEIITRRYTINASPRVKIAAHRLYRAAMKQNRCNTWSAFLILSALYHDMPRKYQDIVLQKFGSITIENRLASYFGLYPDTVRPNQADTTGEHAKRFMATYPKVKNIPYWARMGLPEPEAIDLRSFRADSAPLEDTGASTILKNQGAPLGAAINDSQTPATELDILPDITIALQDSAVVQDVAGAAAQSRGPEARPSNTSPSDEFNINHILGMMTREASPRHGNRPSRDVHQMQQMQTIMQSITRLEETSGAFRNDFVALRDEVRLFMAAMAASISEINKRI